MPSLGLDRQKNLSLLTQMIGIKSLNRNLKAEDCYSAQTNQDYHSLMTGKESKCPVPQDEEMMVAGDFNVTHQQAACPSWLKWLLGILAALLLLFLLLAALCFLLWFWSTLNPPAPPAQPELPQIRFIQPS